MSIEIYDLHYYCSCNSLEKSGHKISQGYFLTYCPSLRKHVSLYTFCNCDQTPKHGDCFEVMKMKLGGSNVGDVLFVAHIMGNKLVSFRGSGFWTDVNRVIIKQKYDCNRMELQGFRSLLEFSMQGYMYILAQTKRKRRCKWFYFITLNC